MKHFNKFLIVPIALASFTATEFSFSKSASAETTLTLNVFFARKGILYKGLIDYWVKAVDKNSGGKIKINIPNASLSPAPRQWDMVSKGVADVALTSNAFQRGRLILPRLSQLPFSSPDAAAASVALWRTHQKHFKKANEYKGMKVLTIFVRAGDVIQSMKKPILSVADFDGFKMISPPGMQKLILAKLGATVVTAPTVKKFEYISKGTVDGTAAQHGQATTFKYVRYLKHVTLIPGRLGNNAFSFIMNQKVWDGLSAEDKAVINKSSGETHARHIGKVMEAGEIRALKAYKEAGVKLHDASPKFMAELKAKLAFMEKSWIKSAKEKRNVDGAKALAFYRGVMKEQMGK